MARYAVGLQYDGSNYHGLQSQLSPRLDTVQEKVEEALSAVAAHPLTLFFAGRTDRGVHATGQVFHFDSDAPRSEYNWLCGANSNLPRDISVTWVKTVSDDFHARFSAVSRRYHYWIYNANTRPAILHNKVTWHLQPLDVGLMQAATQYLIGEHDFSSFRARNCQAKTPIRTLNELTVTAHGDYIKIDICANAFLHHMVRNIVGTLMVIGEGERPPEWIADILAARDRNQADITAPAAGLYLVDVVYPDIFEISCSSAICYNSQ